MLRDEQTDGQTDITKLTVVFRNFAKRLRTTLASALTEYGSQVHRKTEVRKTSHKEVYE